MKTKVSEYQFHLERFLEKFRFPYGYYVLPLFFTLFTTLLPIYLLYLVSSLEVLIWDLKYWILPGAISFLIMIYGIRYIRDRSIEFLASSKKNLSIEDFKNLGELFRKIYTKKYYILISVTGSLLAVIFQVYHLIIHPHPWWIPRYEANFLLTLILAIMTTITTAIFYFILFTLFCFLLGNIYIYKWLCGRLINIEPFHPDRMGGISYILTYVRSLIIIWFITTLPFVHSYIFATVSWWTITIFSIYILATAALVFFFSYFLHKILRRAKIDALSNIMEMYKNIERFLQYSNKKISSDDILKGILYSIAAKDMREIVESMRTFPIRTESLSAILTSTIPLIIQIIKMFIE